MLRSPWVRWSVVLGIALGGFFDGILLHQILQWHHLLSLVPGAGDLRFQVLWDGYFHALMYVVAVVGLWGLWRAHRKVEGGWGRQLSGGILVGLGARSSRALMAPEVCSRARNSSTCPSSTSTVITAAASK